MAEYIVRVWDTEHIIKKRELTRRTRPSAFLAYERAIYDTLAAFGKLDTVAAHAAMTLAVAQNDIMQPGEARQIAVSNTGHTVSVQRVS